MRYKYYKELNKILNSDCKHKELYQDEKNKKVCEKCGQEIK